MGSRPVAALWPATSRANGKGGSDAGQQPSGSMQVGQGKGRFCGAEQVRDTEPVLKVENSAAKLVLERRKAKVLGSTDRHPCERRQTSHRLRVAEGPAN